MKTIPLSDISLIVSTYLSFLTILFSILLIIYTYIKITGKSLKNSILFDAVKFTMLLWLALFPITYLVCLISINIQHFIF